jgi:hypothetical protein
MNFYDMGGERHAWIGTHTGRGTGRQSVGQYFTAAELVTAIAKDPEMWEDLCIEVDLRRAAQAKVDAKNARKNKRVAA